MTMREKISCMHNSPATEIHLWKEGIFWVAYEESAYVVWLLKKYKPTKKFIKSVDMEVVSIGFPHSVLVGAPLTCAQFPPPIPTDTHIIIPATGISFVHEEFLSWKNALPVSTVVGVGDNKGIHPLVNNNNAHILARIKDFDLSYATPMDCMNFLAVIKKDLQMPPIEGEPLNGCKKSNN